MADRQDAYLAQRVRDAVVQDPRANELDVRVEVAGRKIFLLGTVSSPERREQVAAVARECAPDFEIRNETSVAAYPEAEEAEQLS